MYFIDSLNFQGWKIYVVSLTINNKLRGKVTVATDINLLGVQFFFLYALSFSLFVCDLQWTGFSKGKNFENTLQSLIRHI